MKLVVGLGNPGRRYAATRHNVGFRIVERLAERHRILVGEPRFQGLYGAGTVAGVAVGILEPTTYMNASGRAVVDALRSLPVESPGDLLVVFDDVDLPFGRLRVRASGSDGGHRGMADIIERLGSHEFPRIRFGIGRSGIDTVEHVLQRFSAEEADALPRLADRAAEAIETLFRDGVRVAMNGFNAPPED